MKYVWLILAVALCAGVFASTVAADTGVPFGYDSGGIVYAITPDNVGGTAYAGAGEFLTYHNNDVKFFIAVEDRQLLTNGWQGMGWTYRSANGVSYADWVSTPNIPWLTKGRYYEACVWFDIWQSGVEHGIFFCSNSIRG